MAHEGFRQETKKEGLAEKLRHVSDAQAPHQIESMDLDGPDADLQLMSDFSVGQPLCDQFEDLSLSRGQCPGRFGPCRQTPFSFLLYDLAFLRHRIPLRQPVHTVADSPPVCKQGYGILFMIGSSNLYGKPYDG